MAEIVRKIGKITKYETKSYVGSARILDLDKATETETTGGAPRESASPSSDAKYGATRCPRRDDAHRRGRARVGRARRDLRALAGLEARTAASVGRTREMRRAPRAVAGAPPRLWNEIPVIAGRPRRHAGGRRCAGVDACPITPSGRASCRRAAGCRMCFARRAWREEERERSDAALRDAARTSASSRSSRGAPRCTSPRTTRRSRTSGRAWER